MTVLNENIAYLENCDFDDNGKLKINTNGKPCVIMIQGNFCGYCTQMKPAFNSFVNKMKDKIMPATIQIDGNASEKELAKRLGKVMKSDFQGVPVVIAIKGDAVKLYKGDRSEASLIEFGNSL